MCCQTLDMVLHLPASALQRAGGALGVGALQLLACRAPCRSRRAAGGGAGIYGDGGGGGRVNGSSAYSSRAFAATSHKSSCSR